MQVTVFAPEVWRPAMDAAAAELPPRAAALMRAIVRYLHDRHVGLAPRPAGRLALALLGDGRGRRPVLSARRQGVADWVLAFERLADGVLPVADGGDGRAGRSPATIVPSAVPYALLDRVALPLAAAAQRQLGRCYLFGAEGHAAPADGARLLDAYEADLDAELGRLCAGLAAEPPRLFWRHEGTDVAALSRRGGPAAGGLPEADAETVMLLQELDPVLGPAVRRHARSVRPHRAALQASGARPREGGVAGIRATRSIDDVDDMLVSEFANERLILLDRLVNTGFLVRHRPPRRQNRRDVLLVGALPLGARDAARRLAKVSWIDTMARLAPVLQSSGLPRSDFAWLDGDRLGGVAHGFAGLPEGRPLPGGDGWTLSPADRVRFVWALDWLPGLLDRRRTYPDNLDPPQGEHADDVAAACARWTHGALAHALGGAPPAGDGDGRRPDLNDYGFVHVMVVLPHPTEGLEDGAARSAVFAAARALGLDKGRRQTASVLWIPERADDLARWCVAFDDGPLLRVMDALAPPAEAPEGGADAPDPHRLAGGLIGLWLTHLHEAILGG
ncbi:hypothetical protein [Azospirillum canadense]|uniref:hypothetical protein n=1 Tax=Azospirillum canadense TaxID=403962 RepID=UPI0022270FDD|nr:hypothetical protein [Azospirillum canadense]MCW2243156.1 hypothetical protein [Azospirillum canadense]